MGKSMQVPDPGRGLGPPRQAAIEVPWLGPFLK